MEPRIEKGDDAYLPVSVSMDIQAHSETDSIPKEILEAASRIVDQHKPCRFKDAIALPF